MATTGRGEGTVKVETEVNPQYVATQENDEETGEEVSTEEPSQKGQPPVCADGAGPYLRRTLYELFLGSKLNVLLLATPFAFMSNYLGWGEVATFSFSLVALVPFAERVSFVTEDVAKYTNDTMGGLLNASFGNITELIVCIFALKAGYVRVVQVSMLGSVLSNLLLVLGSAFVVGGLRHKEQRFNKAAAATNSGLLVIAVLALSLPSVLDATHDGLGGNHTEIISHHTARSVPLHVDVPGLQVAALVPSLPPSGVMVSTSSMPAGGLLEVLPGAGSWLTEKGTLEEETLNGGDAPLWLSRILAMALLSLYCMLLFFQLKTHSHLFEGEPDEDEEPGLLGLWGGVFWLALITVFISLLSDFIVDTISAAAKQMGIPILFLSGVLVPIVGNAAEHAAAITFAYRNKMEICLGSAVGSAVQISVFVIPLCVIIGWIFDKPMTMNFHFFETSVLLLTCIGVSVVLMDGQSHWLKGAILVMAYFMIAASFWAHADPDMMS